MSDGYIKMKKQSSKILQKWWDQTPASLQNNISKWFKKRIALRMRRKRINSILKNQLRSIKNTRKRLGNGIAISEEKHL